MADPDLHIRKGAGRGGGHPDPEIRELPGLQNNFGPQFGPKNKGRGAASPGSATGDHVLDKSPY